MRIRGPLSHTPFHSLAASFSCSQSVSVSTAAEAWRQENKESMGAVLFSSCLVMHSSAHSLTSLGTHEDRREDVSGDSPLLIIGFSDGCRVFE